MLRAAGLRLAALRMAKGWTQEQLAALIGASRGQLAMWETGSNKPDPLALARAQIHGIPMEWVMLGLTRHIDYGDIEALMQHCAALGAAVGGPVVEFPALAETRQALSPAAPAAAQTPRRRVTQLHEAVIPFKIPPRHKQ